MKILALDTATEACSAALLFDDDCEERYQLAPRQHTELILPMIDELLSAAEITLTDLDALAFNCGPGSFTGVRIAASVVQGLAFSADLPVVSVSSLAALAQSALREEQQTSVLSLIDARMNEVYWGCYQEKNGWMTLQNSEKVSPIIDLKLTGRWHCRGSGWDVFQQELKNLETITVSSFTPACFPHARDGAFMAAELFRQGGGVKAEEALPCYLRDEVSWKKIAEQ